jgi:hypothetical protein
MFGFFLVPKTSIGSGSKHSICVQTEELDPDFTPEEHAEFERLEKAFPYREEPEDKPVVPGIRENATDGKHDTLFLLIFILLMAVFLLLLLSQVP